MQVQFPGLPEGIEPDRHALVPERRLRPVGAEQPVPPGQVETEVAVGFGRDVGVVDPVHVRRHDEPAQRPVEPRGQAQIAVIEHRGAVQQHLENQHGHGRRAEDDDGGQLEQHRQDNLDRMEAGAGRHVEIQVGMVHAMQPPQRRYGVEHDVLEVDDQIQHDDRERNLEPEGQGDRVEQAPAALRRQQGQPDGRQRKDQPHQDRVERHDADIAVPAQPAWPRERAARRGKLPQRDEGEDAEKEAEPDGRFAGADELRHVSFPSGAVVPAAGIRSPGLDRRSGNIGAGRRIPMALPAACAYPERSMRTPSSRSNR